MTEQIVVYAHNYAAALPALVSGSAWELAQDWARRRTKRGYVNRPYSEDAQREGERLLAAFGLYEQVLRRQRSVERTSALLANVWREEQPFLLYLRSFSLGPREKHGDIVKYSVDPLHDLHLQVQLDKNLDVPLLKVANAHELIDENAKHEVFLAGNESWARAVDQLVAASPAILLYYDSPSEGVRRELESIRRHRKREDTFVLVSERAKETGPLEGLRTLPIPMRPDASFFREGPGADFLRQLVAKLGASTPPRAGPPESGAHWISAGEREKVRRWYNASLNEGLQYIVTAPRRSSDALTYAFGAALALEDLSLVSDPSFLLHGYHFYLGDPGQAHFQLGVLCDQHEPLPPDQKLMVALRRAMTSILEPESLGSAVDFAESVLSEVGRELNAGELYYLHVVRGFRTAFENGDPNEVDKELEAARESYVRHRDTGGGGTTRRGKVIGELALTVPTLGWRKRKKVERLVRRHPLLARYPDLRDDLAGHARGKVSAEQLLRHAVLPDEEVELERFVEALGAIN